MSPKSILAAIGMIGTLAVSIDAHASPKQYEYTVDVESITTSKGEALECVSINLAGKQVWYADVPEAEVSKAIARGFAKLMKPAKGSKS